MQKAQTPPLLARGLGKRLVAAVAGVVMLATGGMVATAANAEEIAVEQVSDSNELVNAISNATAPVIVELVSDIQLDSTLEIAKNKDVTLTGGNSLTFNTDGTYAEAGNGKAAVKVDEGGSLTLAGDTALSGEGFTNKDVSALYSNGKVTLDGGSIENFNQSSGNRSVILSEGEAATFDIKAGSIRNNVSGGNPGGVLEASKGAKLTMSGGEITGNKALTDADMAAIVVVGISQYANIGDGTNNDPAGSFEFTGGEITDNTATTTVYVGESNAALMPQWHQFEVTFNSTASMTMSGDAMIDGNTGARFGGGVGVWGPGAFTMSGGTISGNTSPMGAGVAAVDTFSMGTLEKRVLRSDAQYGGVSLDDWSKTRPAAFAMNGGSITGNKGVASDNQPVGAGVYVSSNKVQLNAGTISDNTAVSEKGGQGGGVYVSSLPYTVTLRNAYVSDNTATVLGGGMWLCPMGGAESYVKNSGAIIGNKSEGAGNDIVSLAKTREGGDTGASLSVLDRLLGNYKVDWYQDGAVSKAEGVLGVADTSVSRYPTLNNKLGGTIDKNKDDIALQAVTQDDAAAKNAAKSQAKLFITGNKAVRGGGIGANGIVQFGDAPVVYPNLNVKVTKKWTNENHPDSVTVTLLQYDAKGAPHAIADTTLNADNNWTYTFTADKNQDLLPKYGAYGEDHAAVATGRGLSRYVVEENVPDGYSSSVSDWTHTVTVSNKLSEDSQQASDSLKSLELQSAFDYQQLVDKDGAYTETFANVEGASGTSSSKDGYEYVTFSNLPDTAKTDAGAQTPLDYRVRTSDGKTNEDFQNLASEKGFNGLPEMAKVEETISATITNEPNIGNLEISKAVEGNDSSAKDSAFRFTVKLKDSDGVPVSDSFDLKIDDANATKIEFKNGEASFNLKNGQKAVLSKLPAGAAYTVTEDANGCDSSLPQGGATGTIAALKTAKVAVTNTCTVTPTPSETVVPGESGNTSKPDKTKMPATGAAVAAIAGVVAILAAAGVALTLARRRVGAHHNAK